MNQTPPPSPPQWTPPSDIKNILYMNPAVDLCFALSSDRFCGGRLEVNTLTLMVKAEMLLLIVLSVI